MSTANERGLVPDLDAMVAHLHWHRPGGPWVLTASPGAETRTFTASDEQAMRAWVHEQNVERRLGIYVHVNGTLRWLTKKAEKTAAPSWATCCPTGAHRCRATAPTPTTTGPACARHSPACRAATGSSWSCATASAPTAAPASR
jgi:hypothetical protein